MTALGQLTNIAGAFALTRSVVRNRIAIVDDVVTSCNTVAELASDQGCLSKRGVGVDLCPNARLGINQRKGRVQAPAFLLAYPLITNKVS